MRSASDSVHAVGATGLCARIARKRTGRWLRRVMAVYCNDSQAHAEAVVAPANEAFGSTVPGSAPANWRDLRDQWELGHTIRFALRLLSLGLIVASVVFNETPGRATPDRGGA